MKVNINIFQILVSAMFWVGAFALVSTLLKGNFELLALFGILVGINLVLLLILAAIAPSLFKQLFGTPSASVRSKEPEKDGEGQIAFQLYPIAYPRILDDELHDYAPELIHIDIARDNFKIFSGNIARNTLRQLRDAIGGVLTVKEVPIAAVQKPAVQNAPLQNPSVQKPKDEKLKASFSPQEPKAAKLPKKPAKKAASKETQKA